MKSSKLNHTNFLKTVSQSGIVVVDCWSCEQLSPVIESVAHRYPDHTFASLDTQKEDALTKDLGIKHTPMLMVFRDGYPVFCRPGIFTEAGVIDIIDHAQSLDMNVFKNEMAALQAVRNRTVKAQTAQACH